MSQEQIILIGDSIRMGYEGHVRRLLDGVAQVWGPDENCRNSKNILDHLEEWVISRPCSIVHINCGLHDIRKESTPPASDISIEEYEANVREILSRISKKPNTRVIWATTTPVIETLQIDEKTQTYYRRESDVTAYNDAASQIARDMGIPINDLHGFVTRAGCSNLIGDDGVHFTDNGYSRLGETVAEFLKTLLHNKFEKV